MKSNYGTKFKKLVSATALALMLSVSASALPQVYYPVQGPYIQIAQDQRLTEENQVANFSLLGWTTVDSIYVSAHSRGLAKLGRLAIEVDGVRVSVINLNFRSKSFQIPVGRVVGGVTIRALSDRDVVVETIAVSGRYDSQPGGPVYPGIPVNPGYPTNPCAPNCGGFPNGGFGQIGAVAYDGIRVLDQLQPLVGLTDFTQNLMPLKQALGRLLAVARAHGDAASETRVAAQQVLAVIQAQESFLNQLLERSVCFGLVSRLLQDAERIADLVD